MIIVLGVLERRLAGELRLDVCPRLQQKADDRGVAAHRSTNERGGIPREPAEWTAFRLVAPFDRQALFQQVADNLDVTPVGCGLRCARARASARARGVPVRPRLGG